MHFERGNADKPSHFHGRGREEPIWLGGGGGGATEVGSMCDLFFFQVLKFHGGITGHFLLGGMEGFLNTNNAGNI